MFHTKCTHYMCHTPAYTRACIGELLQSFTRYSNYPVCPPTVGLLRFVNIVLLRVYTTNYKDSLTCYSLSDLVVEQETMLCYYSFIICKQNTCWCIKQTSIVFTAPCQTQPSNLVLWLLWLLWWTSSYDQQHPVYK